MTIIQQTVPVVVEEFRQIVLAIPEEVISSMHQTFLGRFTNPCTSGERGGVQRTCSTGPNGSRNLKFKSPSRFGSYCDNEIIKGTSTGPRDRRSYVRILVYSCHAFFYFLFRYTRCKTPLCFDNPSRSCIVISHKMNRFMFSSLIKIKSTTWRLDVMAVRRRRKKGFEMISIFFLSKR